MDVHILKVFASVYRNRSFTRASEELNLSQPTVSEYVKRLEEELGTQLFDRVGRRTIPTREAALLFARATEIIERIQGIKEDLARSKEEVKGLLTVGASAIPGAYVIPHLAAAFRQEYPEVFFQVVIEDSARIAEQVLTDELFLGVVDVRVDRDGLDYESMMEDELVLAAAPGFIGKKEIGVQELRGVPILMMDEGSGARRSMDHHHMAHGVSLMGLQVAAILGSTDSLKEAVKSGLGASILSRFAVRDELKAGTVEEVRIRGVQMRRDLYVVTHRRRTLPGEYRAFLEYLRREVTPPAPEKAES